MVLTAQAVYFQRKEIFSLPKKKTFKICKTFSNKLGLSTHSLTLANNQQGRFIKDLSGEERQYK